MSERNWQEDWDYTQKYMPRSEVHELYTGQITSDLEKLAYWLQEIKRLKRELAAALCDHEREKSMRVSLATLAEGERRRAEAAEMKLEAIKEMLIEEDEIDRECMMMARAQQG